MSAAAWLEDLRSAIANYSRTRPAVYPVVRVTLHGGESFLVMRANAWPGDRLVSFDVYPEGNPPQLLEHRHFEDGHEQVDRVTPLVLLVDTHHVLKVELLHDHPGRGGVGFAVEDA